MYSNTDIIAKSWLVVEVTNQILAKRDLLVDKIFLIGSYANGDATSRSDIDFLIQLKGFKRPGMYYPSWEEIEEIHKLLDTRRIHVIFGTEEAQKSLAEKQNKQYREISQGALNANTCKSVLPQ
jgi:predicted nucleotidyltransferase